MTGDIDRVIAVGYYTEIHSGHEVDSKRANLMIVGCRDLASFWLDMLDSNMEEYLGAAACGLAMELSILGG